MLDTIRLRDALERAREVMRTQRARREQDEGEREGFQERLGGAEEKQRENEEGPARQPDVLDLHRDEGTSDTGREPSKALEGAKSTEKPEEERPSGGHIELTA